ncbi:outer membrane protein [Bosea sp. WAO]|uniref:outer membrane protein n=1 Tax=Bosea sp. WAO TaxID=406341 RepID=UPI0008317ED4|nr:outer membrane protein [Bosea sp. WAO]
MMSIKHLLTGGIALASLIGSSAFAADLPSRKFAPVAPVVPVFTWTGFYVGLNAGASWSHGSTGIAAPAAGWFNTINVNGAWRKSEDNVNFTGGAQAGYNYQTGSFVLGVETDFNYGSIESKRDGFGRVAFGAFANEQTFSTKTKVEWFGTLRARVGVTPMERLMIFGTGGLAYGNVKASAAETDRFLFNGVAVATDSWHGSKNDTRIGWTLGAGAEYALTNNLSLKAEYLYVDLGKQRYSSIYTGSIPALAGTVGARVDHDTKFSIVRAGVNYRF